MTVSPGSGDSTRICGVCSSIAPRPIGGSTTTPSPPIASTGTTVDPEGDPVDGREPRERRDDLCDASEHRRASAPVVEGPVEIDRGDASGDGDVAQRGSRGDRAREAGRDLVLGRPGEQLGQRARGPPRAWPRSSGAQGSPSRRGGSRRRRTTLLRRRLARGRRPGRRRRRRRLVAVAARRDGDADEGERGEEEARRPTRHARIVPRSCSEISRPPRGRVPPACARRSART